jgi:hypothetical protein
MPKSAALGNAEFFPIIELRVSFNGLNVWWVGHYYGETMTGISSCLKVQLGKDQKDKSKCVHFLHI